ncbi:MAG: sigma-70 family RNA polymerase sigma factor [Oscillospiraceae bacterium]|nr:sigma-70 family RNA polymerase sigma factor [Oscillospiraceae bacterium]
MEEFEELLARERGPVERFVRFRLPSRADADDVLQEVYLTAFQRFGQLRDRDSFRPWLLSIARNKCSDYFREKAKSLEIPIDAISESVLSYSRTGPRVDTAVRETLALLGDKDKQILYLYFWKELPQAEIARRLGLPLGTVKSRLHTAKRDFKDRYPCPNKSTQGGKNTKKLPDILPDYTIEPMTEPPFPVKWEELPGWMLIPRLGEKLTWGLYEMPSRKRTEWTDMKVVGRAEVHGIEGVEFVAVQHDAENYFRTGSIDEIERRFVAQLTDTHCRFLAESHLEDGVRKCYTFLDGASFLDNWGFGPDNCGQETALRRKGILTRDGNTITGEMLPNLQSLDIVGRYRITINGKTYDTVCVMDIECFDDAVASEQFVDQNGRTVLWRRFNKNDWAFHRYGKLWTELLPDNERILVNGQTYVHWYDCITDYIL